MQKLSFLILILILSLVAKVQDEQSYTEIQDSLLSGI